MEDDQTRKRLLIFTIIGLIFLLLLAVFIGMQIGRSDEPTSRGTESAGTETAEPANTEAGELKELVSYTLPDGWREETCDNTPGVIYPIAPGRELECSNDPDDVISILVDPDDTTDCNQLQNVRDVSKHICRSIFIDNHKTLEATTQYNQDSGVLPNRTVDAYYMDTGNGVVLVRYIHSEPGDKLSEFKAIANSLRVK